MGTKRTRRHFAVGLTAIVAIVAACGSDDDADGPADDVVAETDAPQTSDAPEASDAPTPTPTEGAPDTGGPTTEGDSGGDPFGVPNPASGEPLVFGMLSQEAGPVTFPEVSAAARAAVEYVNQYRGGIGGRPIQLEVCVTDGQPSTSERCANQILDMNPVAILGAIDTGSSASMPVWERANLAYLGGLPLTPAENSSPNSIQFYQASIGDNAAGAAYAATVLEAESAYVIYTDDPQGQSLANDTIIPTFEQAGVDEVDSIAVPPASADLSAAAAAAVSTDPDVVFVVVPNACANMMLALESVGNEAQIFTIGPCFDPRVIEAAGTSMVGVMHASPFLDRTPATPQGALFFGALDAFADEGTPPNPLALGGFGTVINVQERLDGIDPGELDTESILNAFRSGSDHPNFMAHPYTCDGEQLGPFVAACNPYEVIYQVQEDLEEILIDDQWFSPAEYLS